MPRQRPSDFEPPPVGGRALDHPECALECVLRPAFLDLNGYLPIFRKYEIPVRYNFKPEDMSWSVYRPRAKMRGATRAGPKRMAA